MKSLINIQIKQFFFLSTLIVIFCFPKDCKAANFCDNPPCQSTPNVKDYDGNVYKTVQIGNQCWMKENLRTKHYSDGTPIYTSSNVGGHAEVPLCYYPSEKYGLMYNWKAVMRNSFSSDRNPSGVQGVCPTGWHVPSEAEWIQLKEYVSSQTGYTAGENNGTGLSPVKAGYYSAYQNKAEWVRIGEAAYFWSTTRKYYDYRGQKCNCAYCHYFYHDDAGWRDPEPFNRSRGLSVRCLRD